MGYFFIRKKKSCNMSCLTYFSILKKKKKRIITFFLRVFQPMTFAPNDSSLSSDQDTNQFLV